MSVSKSCFYHLYCMSLQFKAFPFHSLGPCYLIGYLSREEFVAIIINHVWCQHFCGVIDNGFCGDAFCIWKPIEQHLEAEKMIAMAMCDIDVFKIFPCGSDPFHQ